MTFASSPALVEVPESTSINTILRERVARSGEQVLIERRDSPTGPWIPVTARAFEEEVFGLARGLVARGVNQGDRIAIMSRTRYEWTLLDFAIWAVGGIPVPVYETSSAEQVHWILGDAGVRLAVVETAQHAEVVNQAWQHGLPMLEDVLLIDDDALTHLRDRGTHLSPMAVSERRDAVQRDDIATIIYTSGSTGRPKGAVLSHGNFAHLVMNAAVGIPELVSAPGARTLLFLPLAHVFARFVEVSVIGGSAVLGHSPDVKNLVPDLGSFRPTFLLAVPRVFEKVYNSAEQKAGSGVKNRIFTWAAGVAGDYSRALDSASGPRWWLRTRHGVADRLVFSNLRAALGGNLKWAVSGGAPLGERLGHFFRGVGVTILEGYGLTETTAPTAVNLPGRVAIGTVGPAFFGTAVRIADDGEILLAGPHIFHGYLNQPELTAEALDGGWFRTGDLGTLDERGNLRITGRKKEIIVTAGGKNVAPAQLEDRLRAHPIISQVVVVGDQRPFIGALVTLDAEMLPGWCATNGLPALTVAEARMHPTVLASIDQAVNQANEAVSKAESIRKIAVLEGDFTEANGYLTPSIKVKRAKVIADFAPTIEALYGGGPAAPTTSPFSAVGSR
ncbi:AMP-dependent synthetase/ligase [Antribacter gilvus]|uniref:AMP-dependent synthetase/ligase n=1 Tax=Antribacter gilvus TaxID=2304675 RepID=UPI000F798FAF|nr:AMP-dependent synthetase/ligase [Antribacter gilvus]